MNKHVNKVRKATGRAEAITAGRQQNKQQFFIYTINEKEKKHKDRNFTHANGKVWYDDAAVGDDHDVLDAFLGHVAAQVGAVAVVPHRHVERVAIGVADRHGQRSDTGRARVDRELQRTVRFHAVLFQALPVSRHLTDATINACCFQRPKSPGQDDD